MQSTVINTRADLDALAGTPEHSQFTQSLRGTLWRLEKDDAAKAWVATENNTTIERFGFIRADFAPVIAPDLPAFDAPTPADIQKCRMDAVQAHLDQAAQALGYDDIKSAATYADEDAVLKFQQEGQSLRAWRSLVWEHCFTLLASVQAGKREIPSEAELIAGLPQRAAI